MGPIDYIVVGFEGNKFDGSILSALGDAIDNGTIALVALSVIVKDADGTVTTLDMSSVDDEAIVEFTQKYPAKNANKVDQDDIDEVADLINENCAAGLLVIEQLWAKPLKKAIVDAGGVLLSEGRIHPEAAQELEN